VDNVMPVLFFLLHAAEDKSYYGGFSADEALAGFANIIDRPVELLKSLIEREQD
jgi:hypothetical protein